MSMITDQNNTVVIAETACAHEGNAGRLLDIIDAVANIPIDAIKFHGFTADGRSVPGTTYNEVVSNLEISQKEWPNIIQKANAHNIDVVVDVFDIQTAKLMNELEVDAFKIHAADIQNTSLLQTVAKTDVPILLYVGGATKIEIHEAIEQIREYDPPQIGLMYGLQNYPTSLEEANLGKISSLKDEFSLPVGYASHVPGGSKHAKQLPMYAAAAGADLIECHITLDRKMKRVDYISSLNPDEFQDMVFGIREVDTAIGNSTLKLTDAEREYRQGVRKTLYSKRKIKSGEKITEEDVAYLRGDEMPDHHSVNIEQIIGKPSIHSIEPYSPITMTDVETKTAAVLACRSESTRLYGKPLQLLGNKPILKHIVDGLSTVSNIDEIILAIADTPSQSSYIDFAENNNLSYIVGPEIDVLKRCILAAQEASADFIVKANTENPYIAYDLVGDAVSEIAEKNADLVVMEDLPLGSAVDTVSTQALTRSHAHGSDRHRSEFTSRFILENSDSFNIHTVVPPQDLQCPDIRLTVDYPSDLVLAREIRRNLTEEIESPYIPLRSVLSLLKDNPDIRAINQDYVDGTSDSIKSERPFAYGSKTR